MICKESGIRISSGGRPEFRADSYSRYFLVNSGMASFPPAFATSYAKEPGTGIRL